MFEQEQRRKESHNCGRAASRRVDRAASDIIDLLKLRRRRDGRVAEGARLESVYTLTGIVGSNPTLSARNTANRMNAEVSSLGEKPGAPALLFSLVAHLAALILIVVFWRAGGPHIVPEHYETVQRIPGPAYLSSNSKNTQTHAGPSHMKRSTHHSATSEAKAGQQGVYTGTVREQAKQATADIMHDLRFRQLYGFSPTYKYELAVQTAGELPPISAAEVPPHFQQYVIVEVTIDVDGRVAEERIVAGVVDPMIQQKLLSAIREFKYSPAKRDGVPIPSQRDIVIHIPT
jgi:TonB family protein